MQSRCTRRVVSNLGEGQKRDICQILLGRLIGDGYSVLPWLSAIAMWVKWDSLQTPLKNRQLFPEILLPILRPGCYAGIWFLIVGYLNLMDIHVYISSDNWTILCEAHPPFRFAKGLREMSRPLGG